MALWHFSEDGGIERFVPHVARTSERGDAWVWAIDDWHAPMYFTPRDCPRACFWAGPQTTAEHREHWLAGLTPRFVMVVESGWLERIRNVKLFRYRMPEASFELNDETAGHHISAVTVEPLGVEPVGDLLNAIAAAGVELRVTPRLRPLWSRITLSTLQFSGTRLRDALD